MKEPIMQLRTLRAFVEVVRQGGYSHAGSVLFATQSTISKAVRQLEDEVSTPLFTRSGRQRQLTPAGELVYASASKILAQEHDMKTGIAELVGAKRGRLRVGFPRAGTSSIFASLFAAYRERHPLIEVELVINDRASLEECLRDGTLDVAALLLPIPDEFDWQCVRTDPLMAVLPASHALAHQDNTSLAALAQTPFILFDEGYSLNQIILHACHRLGFEPQVVARSAQVDFLVELVAAGMGVAFLPRTLTARRLHAGVRFVELQEPDTQWRVTLAWRRGQYLSHATEAWLALARELYAQPEMESLTDC